MAERSWSGWLVFGPKGGLRARQWWDTQEEAEAVAYLNFGPEWREKGATCERVTVTRGGRDG